MRTVTTGVLAHERVRDVQAASPRRWRIALARWRQRLLWQRASLRVAAAAVAWLRRGELAPIRNRRGNL